MVVLWQWLCLCHRVEVKGGCVVTVVVFVSSCRDVGWLCCESGCVCVIV